MNERMYELARQADAYAWQQIDEGADYDKQPRYFAEKFAELIVQECVTIIENRAPGQFGKEGKGWTNGYDDGLKTGSFLIKQHFGVE